MSNLVILNWQVFEIKQNLKKKSLLFRSEIGIFDIFFKRLYIESFEDLQITVIENIKPVPLCPIKWQSFKVFVKLHKSPLLIADIVKGVVSGLRKIFGN